ncbi:MAG: hypothetical protein RLZZ156_106 [Deinococcota bacterium]|jgi:cytochrome c-type biogenesis protein CcmH
MKSLFFLLFFFFSVSLAQTDLELENKARLIGNELRCPVCGGSAITESPSDFARSMLAEVKSQVKAGKSESEIKAFFAGKYGNTVLLKPPFQGVNMLVWILPVLVLLIGAGVLWNYLKRSSHQNPEEVNPAALEQVRRQLEAQRDRNHDRAGHVAGSGASTHL